MSIKTSSGQSIFEARQSTASNLKVDLSGTSANSTAIKVDGSAVTQPVSIAATVAISATSLPLPTGAATAAKQPALGTAGTASTDVLTVQGIASMTALKVDGSAVTQPVSGTFWQATQPVSAASLPLPTGAATSAKQPALGTAGTASSDVLTIQGIASMTALKVDGSASTQPVSDGDGSLTVDGTVTLGAGTAAIGKLAANSGVDIGDVDVTSLPALAAGTNLIGKIKLSDGTNEATVRSLTNSKGLNVSIVDGDGDQITSFGGGTQYTEGDTDTTITGTAMLWEDTSDTLSTVSASSPLPVNIISGAGSGGTAMTDDAAFTVGTTSFTPTGGTYKSTRDSVDDNDGGAFAMTAKRALYTTLETPSGDSAMDDTNDAVRVNVVAGSDLPVTGTFWQATQPVSAASLPLPTGAATATKQDTGNTSLSSIDGKITACNTGAVVLAAGTASVGKLASNSGVDIGDVTINNAAGSGAYVQPGTSATWDMNAQATTSGGATPVHYVSAASTNATSVKSSAGQVYMLTASNTNAAARYLKLYNKASAPTVGTDTPVATFLIPGGSAGAGTNIPIPACGLAFSSGIAFALTTGAADSDTGAVSAGEIVVNMGYK